MEWKRLQTLFSGVSDMSTQRSVEACSPITLASSEEDSLAIFAELLPLVSDAVAKVSAVPSADKPSDTGSGTALSKQVVEILSVVDHIQRIFDECEKRLASLPGASLSSAEQSAELERLLEIREDKRAELRARLESVGVAHSLQ